MSIINMSNVDDCSIMKNGSFEYGSRSGKVKVVIDGNAHIEYHNNGRYIIKSVIKWLNDCEYDMTMAEITIPEFPYSVGDVMNVKINKVDRNKIYYTSTVNGKSWEGEFRKIK